MKTMEIKNLKWELLKKEMEEAVLEGFLERMYEFEEAIEETVSVEKLNGVGSSSKKLNEEQLRTKEVNYLLEKLKLEDMLDKLDEIE